MFQTAVGEHVVEVGVDESCARSSVHFQVHREKGDGTLSGPLVLLTFISSFFAPFGLAPVPSGRSH